MNNENNEMNNMGPTAAPSVPDSAQPNPMGMPDPVQPVTPPVEAVPEQNPAAPMGMAEPAPVAAPVGMPEPAQPVSPMEGPAMGGQPGMPEEPKKNNTVLVVIIAVVLLIGLAVGAYFIFGGKDNEEDKPNGGNNTTTKSDENAATEFLEIAKKFVAAADDLWKNENLVCRNPFDEAYNIVAGGPYLKVSEAPNFDYFLFIDTADSTGLNFGVETTKAVSGWVRVNKETNAMYLSLSDGTNYILDKGSLQKTDAHNLTKNDVVTSGNGRNFQFFNGHILGSETPEDGEWGIGDSIVINSDEDHAPYNDQGDKENPYSPYCKLSE